jgi:hypothetical protein
MSIENLENVQTVNVSFDDEPELKKMRATEITSATAEEINAIVTEDVSSTEAAVEDHGETTAPASDEERATDTTALETEEPSCIQESVLGEEGTAEQTEGDDGHEALDQPEQSCVTETEEDSGIGERPEESLPIAEEAGEDGVEVDISSDEDQIEDEIDAPCDPIESAPTH